jgi:acetyl esterase/lipase
LLLATISALCFILPVQASYDNIRSYWKSLHVQVLEDLHYDSLGKNSAQTLDLYLPPTFPRPLPLIVCIHGGGWSGGDKCMYPAFLLPVNGYAVASINYRLTSEATFPGPLDDCRKAIDWLVANSKRFGLDSNRIGVWGGSAGGHLAALLALGYRDNPSSAGFGKVRAACDWCGPADLTEICRQFPAGQPSHEKLMRGMVTKLLGATPEARPDLAKLASPAAYVHANAPPFLIMHGDKDPTVPPIQSKILSEKLKANGDDCTYLVIKGGDHNFYSLEREKLVIDFFNRTLKKRSGLKKHTNTAGRSARKAL